MKVVILCGGKGTRLREETETRPKPLVKIGDAPILWHIMKQYSHYGFNEFILCLGYKGESIKEYILNLEVMSNDFTLVFGDERKLVLETRRHQEPWSITCVDTGEDTPTGGRLYRIRDYIKDEDFMATYGDGVSDVNIADVLKFHWATGKKSTLTAVNPSTAFGVVEVENNLAKSFKEKPQLQGMINGGFFVFRRDIFSYLHEDSVLEEEPLRKLAEERELAAFTHHGFWFCIDTFKQVEELRKMYATNQTPWMIWANGPRKAKE